ncbi:RNA polymerase sigma factor [Calditerrivibrio nitroreducens]|uniref:RNA polymerase, sigma-24 subunit, RpoE n=1 Tax=Calditerrivibrio nitroreducens (strain DSM 19672 / NBRC 101217 / Yu37-1) TaxID=768670 RepID=E4THP2_CALNY|nr:sigma-70 family RNA polymerase sigma factor [Calditerrivibrio nitroreducens]ADR18867.1 RNA polymerase, sigma-24 subunit, RpoE [Calditerrivibrio nitroreducens DSM 19672]
MSDQILVDEILNGKTEVYELLILKYQKQLFSTVFNIVKDEDLTMDIVQEAFLKAYESLPNLRNKDQFYPWIKRIAINESLMKIDRNKRFVDMYNEDQDEDDYFFNSITDEKNPEKELLDEEIRRYVKKYVDSLPSKLRTVIILREVEDMSYEEIADILKIPIGTVRSRLFNARQIIKERLIKQGLADGLYKVS